MSKCIKQIAFGLVFGAAFGGLSGVLRLGYFGLLDAIRGAVAFGLCALVICIIITVFSPQD